MTVSEADGRVLVLKGPSHSSMLWAGGTVLVSERGHDQPGQVTGCFSWGLEPHTARAVAQSEASEDRPAGWEASVFGGWSSLQMVGDGQTSPSESWDGWSVGCDGGETDLSSVHFPVFCY